MNFDETGNEMKSNSKLWKSIKIGKIRLEEAKSM